MVRALWLSKDLNGDIFKRPFSLFRIQLLYLVLPSAQQTMYCLVVFSAKTFPKPWNIPEFRAEPLTPVSE